MSILLLFNASDEQEYIHVSSGGAVVGGTTTVTFSLQKVLIDIVGTLVEADDLVVTVTEDESGKTFVFSRDADDLTGAITDPDAIAALLTEEGDKIFIFKQDAIDLTGTALESGDVACLFADADDIVLTMTDTGLTLQITVGDGDIRLTMEESDD